MNKVILGLVLGLATLSVHAQTASISLSENSAQLKYALLVGAQSFGRNELGGGFLFNSEDDYVAEASLNVIGEAGASVPGLMLGVGAKLIGANIPDPANSASSYNLMGLALGGQLKYAMPFEARVAVAFEGYYSPAIVSWFDSERMSEWALQLGYEILPQAAIYTEYRGFGADTANAKDLSFGSGFRFGVRMNF